MVSLRRQTHAASADFASWNGYFSADLLSNTRASDGDRGIGSKSSADSWIRADFYSISGLLDVLSGADENPLMGVDSSGGHFSATEVKRVLGLRGV